MEQTSENLVNINEARQFLHSTGLDYLGHLIFRKKTINIGDRMYITWRQFETCMKKESRDLSRFYQ